MIELTYKFSTPAELMDFVSTVTAAMNDAGIPQQTTIVVEPVSKAAAAAEPPKRGRGRPPKPTTETAAAAQPERTSESAQGAVPSAVAPTTEPSAPAASAPQEPAATQEQSAPPVAAAYTIDDVRKALSKYGDKHVDAQKDPQGLRAVGEFIKGFGVQRVSELKAEQYAAVIAKAAA